VQLFPLVKFGVDDGNRIFQHAAVCVQIECLENRNPGSHRRRSIEWVAFVVFQVVIVLKVINEVLVHVQLRELVSVVNQEVIQCFSYTSRHAFPSRKVCQ
jgi:hypothetical protein